MGCVTEEAIRHLAYHLWEAAGEPSGEMDRFWYEAERELLKQGYANGNFRPSANDEVETRSVAAE
jgi:Protein of unknown function (DUF2934)